MYELIHRRYLFFKISYMCINEISRNVLISPKETFYICGVDSKIIFASKAEGGITRINTESWKPGMYFIRTATSSTKIVRE